MSASICKFFASCDIETLSNLAVAYPTHGPIIENFIKVRKSTKTQIRLIESIINDVNSLSKSVNGKSSIEELKADLNDQLLDDPNGRATLSRLETNTEALAVEMGMFPCTWDLEWTWEMLGEELENLRPILLIPELLIAKVFKSENSSRKDPMPEKLKEVAFKLVCSGESSFEMQAIAAWEIGFIRNLFDEIIIMDDFELSLPIWISSENVIHVVDFCEREVGVRPRSEEDGHAYKEPLLQTKEIFDLHKIAEHLMIDSMLDWTAGLIANMIKDKSPEEIGTILDLSTSTVRQAAPEP